KLATIPPRETPSAPVNAATEQPPGAGESLRVSLQNRRRSNFTSDFFGEAASIFSSIIFSFGSNGFSSLNPMERIARSISSSSAAPSDQFCFWRKCFPASTRHFLGTMPTISDPVTRRPRLLADSLQASNAAWSGVSSIFVRFIETPLHAAFDACNESANKRGLRMRHGAVFPQYSLDSSKPARSRTLPHTSQSLSHVLAFPGRGLARLFRRASDFQWACHRAFLPGHFLERRRQPNLLVSPLWCSG